MRLPKAPQTLRNRISPKVWFCLAPLSCAILAACGNDKTGSEAKQLIERTLSDPGSVQYRDVKTFNDGTVCGEYNAKNKLGGYVGFQPFAYFRKTIIGDARHLIVICSNETDKEAALRRVDPNFVTSRDYESCVAAARASASAALSAADLRRQEAKADACTRPVPGF
jgi:hypothetical protein